ncbi:hypothetical protein [Ferrimicrobium acidiphilum]|uniref:hypothetical protein n=2 Tax=Ferrimicrobium acidiphilum TaxID=121039 RepID=UPI0023EF9BFB|nr:hypothetical protein [Ferrimicrobium acidiphilum]
MSTPSQLELVRERMFHAWDGVDSLEIHLLTKHRRVWRVRVEEPSADFTQTEPDIPVYHSSAWWSAPESWRLDEELPELGGERFYTAPRHPHSFVVNGDRYAFRTDGVVVNTGRRDEALERQGEWFVRGVGAGRPYLAARENAQLWYWSAPQLWVCNFNLVLNSHGQYVDGILGDRRWFAHVLASQGNWIHEVPHQARPMLEPRCQQWYTGADWNGDQEVTDDATFFQLWVDMETGFIRRIAKEELDGRTWDLAVTSLRINGEISADTFDLGI